MAFHEGSMSEQDPRLVDPDTYYGEKYGNVDVNYGGKKYQLGWALKMEHMSRDPEKLQAESKALRANKFVELLKPTGLLEAIDDVTYPVDT